MGGGIMPGGGIMGGGIIAGIPGLWWALNAAARGGIEEKPGETMIYTHVE